MVVMVVVSSSHGNRSLIVVVFFIFKIPDLRIEPRCEKTGFFAYAKTKTQISCA